MLFPDKIQSAILFDRGGIALDSIHSAIMTSPLAKAGAQFRNIEYRPKFFRLACNNELVITCEFIDSPTDREKFKQTLASPSNRLLCPDAEARLKRHRSHILIDVAHDSLPDRLKTLMTQVGVAVKGRSLPQFQTRLTVLAMFSLIVLREVPASMVHWTLSNQIYTPEKFRHATNDAVPGQLHVHPVLFGSGQNSFGQKPVGIRTFGARHFIGHEMLIEPNPIPWQSTYLMMLALLQAATLPNGYLVPDGDVWGPEDNSECYRVRHRPAQANDVPIIELEPLLHVASGFLSPHYVPPKRVFDDRNISPDAQPDDQAARDAYRAELRGKRRQAEAIGLKFEVRAPLPPNDPPPAPQPPPPSWRDRRPVFGRKKPDGS